LLDFSQLIRVLDEHHCSFVAVTQNFNTYDSMGRLTLNILLSFAQFERELDAERIRDKIKASKQKGLWMGGTVPLGYEVKDRKLKIVDKEAKIVKLIFEKYRDTRSVRGVAQYLRDHMYLNKARYHKNLGKTEAGKFTTDTVRRILLNPIYAGKLSHKGTLYEGVHEAIISYDEWQEIQRIKDSNSDTRHYISRNYTEAMLKSMLITGDGKYRFMSYHVIKNKTVHYYYKAQAQVREGKQACDIRAIPMHELDTFVLQKLIHVIKAPGVLNALSKKMSETQINANLLTILKKLKDTDEIIKKIPPEVRRHFVILMLERVLINPDNIVLEFTKAGAELFLLAQGQQDVNTDDVFGDEKLICPVNLRKQSGQVKIKVSQGEFREEMDPKLICAIHKAFAWHRALTRDNLTMRELAGKENVSRRYMTKMLRLVNLAPDIIQMICRGQQPETLTLTRILNKGIPVLWSEQRKVFNINCK
jgi:hypothetical protein